LAQERFEPSEAFKANASIKDLSVSIHRTSRARGDPMGALSFHGKEGSSVRIR